MLCTKWKCTIKNYISALVCSKILFFSSDDLQQWRAFPLNTKWFQFLLDNLGPPTDVCQNICNYIKSLPGCNMEDNINYHDGDLGIDPVVMESKEACAQHSLTNEEALFWTFGKNNRYCWLRKSKTGRKWSENTVSGNRECGWGE